MKLAFSFYVKLLLLLGIIFLPACTGKSIVPSQGSTLVATSVSQSYPIKTSTNYSIDVSYPILTPTVQPQPTKGPIIIPSPGINSGVVTGILIDNSNDTPLADQTIYLGDVIKATVGSGFSIGIDQLRSPTTITNTKGEFALGDIKPGEYVVVAWTPFQSSTVLDPDSNEPMIIMVIANKLMDLGKLRVTNPERNP